MTQFTPAMDAALARSVVTVVGIFEIILPNHTIRLLSGSAVIDFGGHIYTGSDPVYGTIIAVADLNDGRGDSAPLLRLTFAPPSDAAAADLASANHQGAPVTIWLAVVNPSTGTVVPDPLVVFAGVLDVPTLKVDQNSFVLEVEVTSAFEQFFFTDDGARLSDNFHQYCWPGETGLNQMTGILQHIYWGSSPPSGVSK